MSPARPPIVSARARVMARMLNQGLTQRAIAVEFNVSQPRVGQIIGGTAIKLYMWETGSNDGFLVWRDVFHRDMRKCAVFIKERLRNAL